MSVVQTCLTPVAPFSVEIWEECCKHCDFKQLRKLSRVCRLFHKLTQKFRFSCIYFIAPRPEEIKRRNVASWIRTVQRMGVQLGNFGTSDATVHLRSLVKKGEISGDDLLRAGIDGLPQGEALANAAETAVSAMMETLPGYSSLTVLDLSYVNLDEHARSLLSLLPSLRSLELYTCRIFPKGPLLHLREFIMRDCIDPSQPQQEPIELFQPKDLIALKIASQFDIGNLLPSLVTAGHLQNLTELTLGYSPIIVGLLSRFLQLCPSLQSLDIEAYGGPVNPLPLSVIPNLRSWRGPNLLIESFVPGRPVETIRISPEYIGDHVYDLPTIKSLLHHAAQSTVPILELELPALLVPGLDVFFLVFDHFPMLKTLKMVFEDEGILPAHPSPEYWPSDVESDADGEEESVVSWCSSDSDSDEVGIVDHGMEAGGSGENTGDRDGSGDVDEHSPIDGVHAERTWPEGDIIGKTDTNTAIAEIPLDNQGHPSRKLETFAVRLPFVIIVASETIVR